MSVNMLDLNLYVPNISLPGEICYYYRLNNNKG